jgi:lysophospholipase L1-like esterase
MSTYQSGDSILPYHDIQNFGDVKKRLKSKWDGKTWTLHGDSITWYDGNALPDGSMCLGYPSIVMQNLNVGTKRNIAVSGASMAKSTNYPTNGSIYVTGSNYPTVSYADVDFSTIFAGTNDFKLNVNLGTIGLDSDTTWDDTTFYGSYRHLIETMLVQNPLIKIYLFTPIKRNNAGYDDDFMNTAGFKLIDYVNAVKAIGQMYAIPVLDLYSLSGITRKNIQSYTVDSLHPNNIGHARIADLVTNFITNN